MRHPRPPVLEVRGHKEGNPGPPLQGVQLVGVGQRRPDGDRHPPDPIPHHPPLQLLELRGGEGGVGAGDPLEDELPRRLPEGEGGQGGIHPAAPRSIQHREEGVPGRGYGGGPGRRTTEESRAAPRHPRGTRPRRRGAGHGGRRQGPAGTTPPDPVRCDAGRGDHPPADPHSGADRFRRSPLHEFRPHLPAPAERLPFPLLSHPWSGPLGPDRSAPLQLDSVPDPEERGGSPWGCVPSPEISPRRARAAAACDASLLPPSQNIPLYRGKTHAPDRDCRRRPPRGAPGPPPAAPPGG